MSKPIILLGAGGHAKVLLDALSCSADEVLGYVSPDASSSVLGIDYLGNDESILRYAAEEVRLVIAVGDIGLRQRLFDAFKARGYSFAPVIHPSAIISKDSVLGEGVQVMAGAVIQAGVRVQADVIINTRASIDHDCHIDAHSHMAVGAILAGDIGVGKRVLIGAGSTVIQGVHVGDDSVVGAGAVVIRDVPAGRTVVGVPAH